MAAPPTFAVAVTSTDRETLLSGAGEIDSAVSEDLRTRLTTAVEAGKPVLLDLSAVTFCDSSGLTALIHGHTTAEAAGTEFVLVTAQRAILRPDHPAGARRPAADPPGPRIGPRRARLGRSGLKPPVRLRARETRVRVTNLGILGRKTITSARPRAADRSSGGVSSCR